MVLQEEDITPEVLLEAIRSLQRDRDTYISNMAGSETSDAIGKILSLIEQYAK